MSNVIDPKSGKTEKPTSTHLEAPTGDPVRKELSDAQIMGVVGGLNPQPLPPGRSQREF